MIFYVAGYFLIQASSEPDWMDKNGLLPDMVWSGSRHICNKYPDSWILGWPSNQGAKYDKKERDFARESMKISESQFVEAQNDFNDLYKNQQFGFPNVFMTSDLALKKYDQYFCSVPNVKLLGLALPETYFEGFFAQFDSAGFQSTTNNGVYLKLRQKETYKDDSVLGYDLLGFDGGEFCSFLCNSLEIKMHQEYGVQYNQYGFISEYDQTEKVSQAIARGDEVVEDGFWSPWLVFEPALLLR